MIRNVLNIYRKEKSYMDPVVKGESKSKRIIGIIVIGIIILVLFFLAIIPHLVMKPLLGKR